MKPFDREELGAENRPLVITPAVTTPVLHHFQNLIVKALSKNLHVALWPRHDLTGRIFLQFCKNLHSAAVEPQCSSIDYGVTDLGNVDTEATTI